MLSAAQCYRESSAQAQVRQGPLKNGPCSFYFSIFKGANNLVSKHTIKFIVTLLLGVAICSTVISGCKSSGGPDEDEQAEKIFQEKQKEKGAISPKGGGPAPTATTPAK